MTLFGNVGKAESTIDRFIAEQQKIDVKSGESQPAKNIFNLKPTDIQFRLMYLPDLFNQQGDVKIFDNIEFK